MKGQGNIIAWVLLVGFTISLAVMVGRWSLQQSEEVSQGIVSMGESDIRCDSVAVSAVCENIGGNINVRVTNKGSLFLKKLRFSGCGESRDVDSALGSKGLGLNKMHAETGFNCEAGSEITIIPMIKIDDKDIGCTQKELNIKTDKCTIVS